MYLTKTFKLKIDEADSTDGAGVFTGYASTFGNEDVIGDIFDKGAFKRTAKARGKGLPILLSHERTQQIGVNLEMEEDEHGLMVRGELMLADIPKARETYAIIKRSMELGRSLGLSIGFIPKKEKWVDEHRHYKEVELLEYSVTPFAANPLADITHVREGVYQSTAQELFALTKRITEAGYENDPAQRELLVKSIERLQALVANDNDVENDDPPPEESDSVEDHSLLLNDLRSFKERLAGVGNYGSRP